LIDLGKESFWDKIYFHYNLAVLYFCICRKVKLLLMPYQNILNSILHLNLEIQIMFLLIHHFIYFVIEFCSLNLVLTIGNRENSELRKDLQNSELRREFDNFASYFNKIKFNLTFYFRRISQQIKIRKPKIQKLLI
jgi:ABC-type methionine transport system ATPase subunit